MKLFITSLLFNLTRAISFLTESFVKHPQCYAEVDKRLVLKLIKMCFKHNKRIILNSENYEIYEQDYEFNCSYR